MSDTLGICRNPNCKKGASGERVELYPGPGEYCPECGNPLEALPPEPQAPFGGLSPLEALEQLRPEQPQTPAPPRNNRRPEWAAALHAATLQARTGSREGGPMPGAHALVAENLRKRYGARWVVDGVTVRVAPGEIVGLLGPNGAGKTTTFGMIVGNVKPNDGVVRIHDTDITRLSMSDRAREGLGYLSQERSIFRRLSVADNLHLILEMRDSDVERRAAIFERIVERFGLRPMLDMRGDTLSGGQQRRVEVARALVAEPSYLLLDEPFSGIDPLTVSELQRLIAELRGDGYGILMTDHNVRDTLAITDRSYVIHNGKVIASGVPAELVDNPDARRFFLGENFRIAG